MATRRIHWRAHGQWRIKYILLSGWSAGYKRNSSLCLMPMFFGTVIHNTIETVSVFDHEAVKPADKITKQTQF